MLRDWGQYQGSKKVQGRVWSLLLGLEKVKAENEGKYERMKEQARLFSQDIKQINQDVNQTFRNHIMFWNRDGIKQQALFHVLAAYSVYNTTPFSLTLKLWDAYILKGEHVLTAMADTMLKVHRKHLLKLPLEGLREFLQDRLGQPWALEDNAMLRHLQALMVELQRMKCDLPSPEEFPTVPLGLERASPEPRPVLASPSCEKLPSEAGLALPAYPSSTSGQDPRPPRLSPRPWSCSIRGPPRGPWLLTPLSEPQRLRVCPACPQPRTALGIGCSHSDFTSLPNLPGNHEAADRWPPAVGSELERWASLPLLPAWATPRATGQAQPCIPTGAPVTGPIQPDEDQATGPRTPFLPCDACSRCPSQGGEGHSGDEALAGPSELPQGLDCPLHPLISMSTRKLEAWVPLEGSVMERVMALKRPAVSSSVPRVVMLAVLEDGAPLS
uniref:Rab-GAP TBC domain-containing protein n=1 Tax=Equus asinus TaxID=9793 RepID=A0A9L0IYC1_EQUAS|nr:TBC1 domain family member 3K-like isoform X4 [Equus asinus]XP_044605686.1 TBC1 domain family member 3K-like isoform X4 [Equus asinus]XP_044605687.1 TBC1 domain family member 3K-like isoform X4 [Equus asinus]